MHINTILLMLGSICNQMYKISIKSISTLLCHLTITLCLKGFVMKTELCSFYRDNHSFALMFLHCNSLLASDSNDKIVCHYYQNYRINLSKIRRHDSSGSKKTKGYACLDA